MIAAALPWIVALSMYASLVLPALASDFTYGQRLYTIGDYAGAFKVWRPLADGGDARAQYSLALMYTRGFGVDRDLDEARRWAEKAVAQGYAPARDMLRMLRSEQNASKKASPPRNKYAHDTSEEGQIKAAIADAMAQLTSARHGNLRYTDIVVRPSATGHDFMILDTMLRGDDGEVLDLGNIRGQVSTKSERHYEIGLTLPEVLYLRNKDEETVRIAIGGQTSRMLWDRKFHTSTVFSFVLDNIVLTAEKQPGTASLQRLAIVSDVKQTSDNWSGPFRFAVTGLEVERPEGGSTASIGSFGFDVEVDGLDLPGYLSAVRGLQPGVERSDNGSDSFVGTVRSLGLRLHASEIDLPNIEGAGFSLAHSALSIALTDLGNDLARLGIGLQHRGLQPAAARELPPWTPSSMTANLVLDRIPLRTATYALVTLALDVALFGEVTSGGELLARLQRDFAARGTRLDIARLEFDSTALKASVSGGFQSDKKAALGITGAIDATVAGLDNLGLTPDAENSFGQELIDRLAAQGRGAADGGQSFRIELTKDARVLVNGQPFEFASPHNQ